MYSHFSCMLHMEMKATQRLERTYFQVPRSFFDHPEAADVVFFSSSSSSSRSWVALSKASLSSCSARSLSEVNGNLVFFLMDIQGRWGAKILEVLINYSWPSNKFIGFAIKVGTVVAVWCHSSLPPCILCHWTSSTVMNKAETSFCFFEYDAHATSMLLQFHFVSQ